MTKFEIRNNMAYASHKIQFEVLRRALRVQQAQPQKIFDWKFWEKTARDPTMTAYLNHGVKARMCETTPFVNSVGSQYVASRARLEQACDSLRSQGQALNTYIGLSDGVVHPAVNSNEHIAKSLPKIVKCTWSAMVMRTAPCPEDLFQDTHPNHQVLLSCKPHRPRCHQWRPMQSDTTAEILLELQPDVIVKCYLDAKYYHYDKTDMLELVEFSDTVENLIELDNIMTVQNAEIDEFNFALSLNDTSRSWRRPAQNGRRTLRSHAQSGLNTVNLDTSPKIQVALFAWKKQVAKYLTGVEKVTDDQG